MDRVFFVVLSFIGITMFIYLTTYFKTRVGILDHADIIIQVCIKPTYIYFYCRYNEYLKGLVVFKSVGVAFPYNTYLWRR